MHVKVFDENHENDLETSINEFLKENNTILYLRPHPAQDVSVMKLDEMSNIVVADNKLAMNSEIMSLKQKSVDALNSVDYHQQVIVNCDRMLSELNPEFAEKQQQQAEINELKAQVHDLTRGMSDLMQMNKDLISQLKRNNTDNSHENVGN